MSRSKKEAGAVPVIVGAALVVGLLWTCVFNAFWQWIPILAGCGVGLLCVKLGNQKGGPK